MNIIHWTYDIFQYSQNSAVSHTSESHKTEVQVIWVAPPDSPSSVQFM